MKRSEINTLMQDAIGFFSDNSFYLPPFAYWTPDDWRNKGAEVAPIVRSDLGWDVTDYGLDDFYRYGLLLFTIRNGNAADWKVGRSMPYGEKIVILEVGQEHQMHHHRQKVEDIINRAGGKLVMQLYNAADDNSLDDSPVRVCLDGVWRTLPAGDCVVLNPGESITVTRRLYHKFWAEGERVMMGEVSMINDDHTDNHFHNRIGIGRFGTIVEDEEPLHLLALDYKNYWPEFDQTK